MDAEVRSMYRLLFRTGMTAVRWASPARFALRDKLRRQFRSLPRHLCTHGAVGPTLAFLHRAAAVQGTEHRLLKNLCYIEWSRQHELRALLRSRSVDDVDPYAGYDAAIRALNEKHGLLLT